MRPSLKPRCLSLEEMGTDFVWSLTLFHCRSHSILFFISRPKYLYLLTVSSGVSFIMAGIVFDFKSKRMQINVYTKKKVLNTGLGSWEKLFHFFTFVSVLKHVKPSTIAHFLRYSIGMKIFI